MVKVRKIGGKITSKLRKKTMKKFYYKANANIGGNTVEDVPLFGFTIDVNKENWDSNEVSHETGFKQILNRIFGARGFTIVIPRIRATQNFPVQAKIKSLRISFTRLDSEFLKSSKGAMVFLKQGDFSISDLQVIHSQHGKQNVFIPKLSYMREMMYLEAQSSDLIKPALLKLGLSDDSEILFNDKKDF